MGRLSGGPLTLTIRWKRPHYMCVGPPGAEDLRHSVSPSSDGPATDVHSDGPVGSRGGGVTREATVRPDMHRGCAELRRPDRRSRPGGRARILYGRCGYGGANGTLSVDDRSWI